MHRLIFIYAYLYDHCALPMQVRHLILVNAIMAIMNGDDIEYSRISCQKTVY